jgi:phosphate:Na+ symporter
MHTKNSQRNLLKRLLEARFREPVVNMLVSIFPGNDPMSLQMRVSVFHVIFNVTTTCLLLPFAKQLVDYSCKVIKDKSGEEKALSLKFVDDRLLSMPSVALMQVKKEMDYMFALAYENISLSFDAMETGKLVSDGKIEANEEIIDFTNGALTRFLIKLSAMVEQSDEQVIGSYFHVLNDLERVGDHAENFYEIVAEMASKNLRFSEKGQNDIKAMSDKVMQMLVISKDAFDNLNKAELSMLDEFEEEIDTMKKELTANHFARLAEGNCSMDVSPYYSSTVAGLERVADHLINVGYSIVNPIGSQKEV